MLLLPPLTVVKQIHTVQSELRSTFFNGAVEVTLANRGVLRMLLDNRRYMSYRILIIHLPSVVKQLRRGLAERLLVGIYLQTPTLPIV